MARILLFTGKGGVGKTSLAAATALRAARRGHRTLVISTDAAHNLADVFAQPLGPEPTRLAPNLEGQEIDVYYSVEKHWGKLRDYLLQVFRWRGMDDVFAEEMSVLPGMEEVAGFLWVHEHVESGRYDLIVIDAAPTGETLRFLSLPDVGRWWMEKFFPIQRRVARVLRPAVQAVSDIPVPQEATYDAAERLFRQLDAIHQRFTDPETTSVRLVVNPEAVVIQESQRTLTYLHLFGYPVDAVIVNRVLPEEAGRGYFAAMREAQAGHLERIREAFAPLPILEVPHFPEEVLGRERLERLGEALYGERDPAERFFRGEVFRVRTEDDGRVALELKLPFARREQVDLLHRGHELRIQVGSYRRNLHLPRIFYGRAIERARLESGELHIVFGPREENP